LSPSQLKQDDGSPDIKQKIMAYSEKGLVTKSVEDFTRDVT